MTDEPNEPRETAGKPQKLRFGRFEVPLPRSRVLRVGLGGLFVVGGVFSFLPVLGIWMLPLGLIILSHDFAPVRRGRRRFTVWFHRRYPKLAAWTDPGPQNDLRNASDSR
ncbi:hypothetical protein [Propylenella binzhouense]|uniref:Uncharacterized protein n=1 Tax=Propylenella binzhouense TaxID=2555902 RepID=A0A964T6T8_9HYPH|nr:hypothetical protein [Propylenella binzhouense]MYZ49479.1 hypothetical protein [Propylenella binzhouense]